MGISKRKQRIIIIVFLFLIYLLFNVYRSYYIIQKNYIQLYDTKIEKKLKLIVIGDMHDHVFGEKNEQLIESISTEKPDGIVMIGDMINQDSHDMVHIIDLLESLKKIAPIYYALGNHELEWEKTHDTNLREQLASAGAVVLDKSYCDIKLYNQYIRLGGLYDYAFYFGDLDDPSNKKLGTYNYLVEYQNTDNFKIMLSHRPDSFIFADASNKWNIDLVVSGHLHGGQVVIPFLGGLYAGDQGFFPEYVHGLYEKDNIHILITSGLSTNNKLLPRWNNPPEIIVLELLPQ